MSEDLLQVTDLHVTYGKAQVLQGIDLRVRQGDLVAVVGPNGAGKTSLLRALSRLVDSQGDVRFDGRPLAKNTVGTVQAGLIQCPERRRLFPELTIRQNLQLGAYRLGRSADTSGDLERVYAMFPRLQERAEQYAGTLSGGEQQQCAIGRALMARPRLLLLDEPSLGLSVGVKQVIADSVASLRAAGITTLLVEQDVAFAVRCADRLVVLEHGIVAKEGPAAEVAADPYVREAYLGVA